MYTVHAMMYGDVCVLGMCFHAYIHDRMRASEWVCLHAYIHNCVRVNIGMCGRTRGVQCGLHS